MLTRTHQMREVATAKAGTAIVYRGSCWSKPECAKRQPQTMALNLGSFDHAIGLQGSP